MSNVKKVQYVDSVETNFLFGGERPLTGDGISSAVFNLEVLKRAIAEQARVALPSSYTLVVVSCLFINDIQDTGQAAKERGLLFEGFSFFSIESQNWSGTRVDQQRHRAQSFGPGSVF